MQTPATTLFLMVSPDVELSIAITARRFNGIASDPKLLIAEPTGTELMEALKNIRAASLTPQLTYPIQ
jgi:hypothetical protein